MKKLVSICLTGALTLLLAQSAAVLTNVKGEVNVLENGALKKAHEGEKVGVSGIIETKEGSVRVVFEDNSVMDVAPHSIIKIEKFLFKPKQEEFAFELYMKQGECAFESGKIGSLAPEKFTFKTPEGVVAIRGTKFFVKLQ